jgi:hypothetical protein
LGEGESGWGLSLVEVFGHRGMSAMQPKQASYWNVEMNRKKIALSDEDQKKLLEIIEKGRDGKPSCAVFPENIAKVRMELEDDGAIVIERSQEFFDLSEDEVSESDIFALNFKDGD